MPTIRNIFRRQDENTRPVATNDTPVENADPIDIRQQKEPVEYKLSEINDSGVFVPPSPVEKKSFWSTGSSRSTTSSNHRSLINESEPFNISRESFECYRRSFDISARSPVIQPSEFSRPRASLDSHAIRSPPRSSSSFVRPVPTTTEEDLEDVNLDDSKPQQQQRKKGLFSRLTDSHDSNADQKNSGSGSWHHFGGRKRGQSGQGSELGNFPQVDEITRDQTPKPEKQAEGAVQKSAEGESPSLTQNESHSRGQPTA